MKALLNTSFFFAPAAESSVRAALRDHWIPASNAAGTGPAICLALPDEEGICRLAVQTPFDNAESAQRFCETITAQVVAPLLGKLGADSFTCFSTIMEIIDL